MTNSYDSIRPIIWENQTLMLLDQRLLPHTTEYIRLTRVEAVADAIKAMVVRGAPAIGVSAAYGVVIAAQQCNANTSAGWKSEIQAYLDLLLDARPTAVNLAWAIQRMRAFIAAYRGDQPIEALLQEASHLHEEDIAANQKMGALGAALFANKSGVLTHCNTGSLATAGYGTALGVIRSGYARGLITHVYADETRPWLQGARLTAWELIRDGIPVQLLVEGAAAYLMSQGAVQWVIVGADRIAANGDVANKIGTYSLAVAARYHNVKFMVVAPTSSIDMDMALGGEIPIETRPEAEVLSFASQAVAAAGSQAWNPVFDVTPAHLIHALVTEKGVIIEPNAAAIAELMSR